MYGHANRVPLARMTLAASRLLTRLLIATTFATAAGQAYAVGGRLLATGGVTELEGAGGGGITPWALITGYGTRDEIGASAFYTLLETGRFTLHSAGAAVGFYDRLELSFARQWFDLGDTVPGETIEMNVISAKAKLFGDAIYAQDSVLPQVALGTQFKRNESFDFVPALLGAEDASGVEIYLCATKLILAGLFGRNVLVNGTVRRTSANQLGLLGFGGHGENDPSIQFEGSVGVFLNDSLLLGGEYRSKPDNLRVFEEDDFADLFAAWVPVKGVSVTAAYAWLGNVADRDNEDALYLSAQVSF